jgi:hypothetical protein
MNTPPRPPLKSIAPAPTGPRAAEPAPAHTVVGEPKGAARKGVRTAVGPDPHPGDDGRRAIAWLTISAPGHGAIPTATSRCACGRDRSAVGTRRVLALAADHDAHRATCPLRNSQEGRAA